MKYHKRSIISPGLIFVQKAFLLGLLTGSSFSEGLIFEGSFTFQNGLGLTKKQVKTLRQQFTTSNTNSPWAYIREGLLSEGYFGLSFREGLFLEGFIIG